MEKEIKQILKDKNIKIQEKIPKLNELQKKIGKDADAIQTILDDGIENIFEEKLRKLDEIRENNLDTVNMDDIEKLKDGYAILFKLIESTLTWNEEKQYDLEGVINRASLRAMLIDPDVSEKTKQEVMDSWEDFM